MERALQLIDELNAGDIVEGAIDRHQGLPEPRTIHVTADSINALLGVEVPYTAMVDILNSLCITTTLENGWLTCTVPSFRDDVEGCADLAEEVMRVYGYDHIVATPMPRDHSSAGDACRNGKTPIKSRPRWWPNGCGKSPRIPLSAGKPLKR